MTTSTKITSYLDQLQKACDAAGVDLLQAFLKAGVNNGTFYRTRNGKTELRLMTAEGVLAAVQVLREKSHDNGKTAQGNKKKAASSKA